MGKFSQKETILRDWVNGGCFEGTLILGGTGSGKTSGSGSSLGQRLLKEGFGGLILTVKPEEKEIWQRNCQISNREKDLIIFSENSPDNFNFVSYEKRGEINPTQKCLEIIQSFIENAGTGEGRTGRLSNDSYWDDQKDKFIRNGLKVIENLGKEISIKNLNKLVMEVYWIRGMYGNVKRLKEGMEFLGPNQVEQLNEMLSAKDFAVVNGWINEITELAPNTMTTILSCVTGAIDPLCHEPFLSKLGTLTTISPDDCLFKNKIILIDYPIKKYGTTGKNINLIWKEAF